MNQVISLTNKQTFALYRLPHEPNHYLVQQHNHHFEHLDPHTFHQSGFVFYPFNREEGLPGVFIKKEQLLVNPVISFFSNYNHQPNCIDYSTYLGKVNQFIGATKARFKKLIFSRIKTIPASSADLFPLFTALKETYPDAFVYLVNITGIGCWIGASPEILYRQDRMARTMALAGTQKDLDIPLEEVRWGLKEQEEQSIVERYFQRILRNNRIPFEKSERRTVRAGNVLHLRTDYYFDPKGRVYHLIDDLHPSPAVCGMPKQAAKEFILQHEPHKREYYCGFLGPVNLHQSIHLYVNLRCMQVMKDQFALYVGGGILPDSNPEKEWEETEMKAKTLTNVIEQVYQKNLRLHHSI